MSFPLGGKGLCFEHEKGQGLLCPVKACDYTKSAVYLLLFRIKTKSVVQHCKNVSFKNMFDSQKKPVTHLKKKAPVVFTNCCVLMPLLASSVLKRYSKQRWNAGQSYGNSH